MAKPKKSKKTTAKASISKVNRQITIGFVLVTIILILIIGYFSLSKANIYLTPKKNVIHTNTEVEIMPEVTSTLTSSNVLPGEIINFETEKTEKYKPTQETVQTKKSTGIVKIINNYSKNQTLVATTRLLTPNNLLFRTTKTVIVPAGGEISVNVKADEIGTKYEIGPTKFTIPGLWEGLRDKIYAISELPMSPSTAKMKMVSAQDLELAKQDLINQITTETKNKYSSPDHIILVKIQTLSVTSTAKINKPTENFNFSLTAKVSVVKLLKKDIETIAVNNLKITTLSNQEYLSYNPNSIKYDLIKINDNKKAATVSVNISGLATAKIDNLYKKSDILGLAESDLEKYFKKINGIETIKIKFSPAWVKSVPPLEDHVSIEIVK